MALIIHLSLSLSLSLYIYIYIYIYIYGGYLHATSCHVYHSRNPDHTARLCVLTGFAPRINFLIRGVMF